MPRLHETPDALLDRVFSRQAALRAGLSSCQLRTPRYRRISAGIWTSPPGDSTGVDGTDPRQHLIRVLEALHEELPLHALSHSSAALYWEFRLPRRLQCLLPLHLTRIDDGPRVMRPGFIGHRATNALLLRRCDDGLRVTGPSRTLVDIAGLLEHEELVAVIDGVICAHRTGLRRGVPALRTREQIAEDLLRLRGTRGVRAARAALLRSRTAVDSAPETRLRLMLEDHGFTGFITDHEIHGADGYPVQPDLADRQLRLSLQYEGAHLDREQQRHRDIRRQRATAEARWTEIRIIGRDLEERVRTDDGWTPRAVALVRRAVDVI